MKIIYPGSFDPITNGHIDIINRCVKTFGNIEVLIVNNFNKNHFFDVIDREFMVKKIFENNSNVMVKVYDGLLADYIIENKVNLVVRGIRNNIDFEFEKTLSKINWDLTNGVETVFFSSHNDFVSSSVVKELYKFNGDFSKYVDEVVVNMFKNRGN